MEFDDYGYRFDPYRRLIIRNIETGCEFFRKISHPKDQITYYHFEVRLPDHSEIFRCEVTELGTPWVCLASELGFGWDDFKNAYEFTKIYGSEIIIENMELPWSKLDNKEIRSVWDELVSFYNAKKGAEIHLNEEKARKNLSKSAFEKREEYYRENPPKFGKSVLLFRPSQLSKEHWARAETNEENGMYYCD